MELEALNIYPIHIMDFRKDKEPTWFIYNSVVFKHPIGKHYIKFGGLKYKIWKGKKSEMWCTVLT